MLQETKKQSATKFSALVCILFLISFNSGFQAVRADWSSSEPIFIRTDGSIEPSNAPISTSDKTTYTLTDNIIVSSIRVERSHIILDGAGHLVQSLSQQTGTGIIIADNGGNISIRNFEIRGFDLGIESNTNTISNYKISNNTFSNNRAAIGLSGSGSNNEISDNQIVNNIEGLIIGWAGYNLISRNSIRENLKGIILGINSSHNIILENRLENNGWAFENGCGVELSGSPPVSNHNEFYHNDFVNNRKHLSISIGSTNYLNRDFTSGGNYWGDYTGSDLYSGIFQNESCKDGIGDISYIIDDNNQDQYPLLKPWSEHLNPPVARFQYSPEIGYALQEITCDSSFSYDLDENIKSYSWNFGDGETASTTSQSVTHAFDLPGFYDVGLTAIDEKELSTTYSLTVQVIATTSISFSTRIFGSPPQVSITGSLENMFQEPLSEKLVFLYYSYPGVGNWYSITSATTDSFGRFETIWFPEATGNYTIKVEWKGNDTYAPTTETKDIEVGASFISLLSEPFSLFLISAGLATSIIVIGITIYYLRRKKNTNRNTLKNH